MKKIFSFFLTLMLILLLCLPTAASAMENRNAKIKLKAFTVDLPYEKSQITLERIENDNQVEVIVRDKETNEILSVIGEIIEYISEEKSILMLDGIELQGITTHNTIYRNYTHGAAVAQLWAKLELFTSGSFRQINGVVDHGWRENSDGPWYLTRESTSVVSLSGKYPSTSVNIQGSATITGTATVSHGYSWSISFLESAGFDITNETSSDWHFRKLINHGFRYSI